MKTGTDAKGGINNQFLITRFSISAEIMTLPA